MARPLPDGRSRAEPTAALPGSPAGLALGGPLALPPPVCRTPLALPPGLNCALCPPAGSLPPRALLYRCRRGPEPPRSRSSQPHGEGDREAGREARTGHGRKEGGREGGSQSASGAHRRGRAAALSGLSSCRRSRTVGEPLSLQGSCGGRGILAPLPPLPFAVRAALGSLSRPPACRRRCCRLVKLGPGAAWWAGLGGRRHPGEQPRSPAKLGGPGGGGACPAGSPAGWPGNRPPPRTPGCQGHHSCWGGCPRSGRNLDPVRPARGCPEMLPLG